MTTVVALLADGQHTAVTVLSSRLGRSYEGLSAAAKAARRLGLISAAMAKKCERLDVAAHWARHCTSQKVDDFVSQLQRAIDDAPGAKSASPAHKHLCPPQSTQEVLCEDVLEEAPVLKSETIVFDQGALPEDGNSADGTGTSPKDTNCVQSVNTFVR